MSRIGNHDATAYFGADLTDYKKGMGESVRLNSAAAKQMARDSERAERDRYRAERRRERERADRIARINGAVQVTGVAAAAATGAIAGLLAAGSEQSTKLARDLEAARDALLDIAAQRGLDIASALGIEGLDSTIRRAGEAYDKLISAVAKGIGFTPLGLIGRATGFINGNIGETDAAAAADLRSQQRSAAIGRLGGLTAAATAGQDPLADEINGIQDRFRDLLTEIGEIVGLTAAEKDRLRTLARANRDSQIAAAEDRRRRTIDGTFRTERLRSLQGAASGPDATSQDRAAFARAKAAEQLRGELEAIDALELKAAGRARLRELAEATVRRELENQLEVIRRQAEQAEKLARERRRAAEEGVAARIEDLRIDDMRARGQDEEADRLATRLRFERLIEDVRRNQDLSDASRANSIAEIEALRDAALGRIGAGGGDRDGRTLGLGLSQTTREQIAGGPGEDRVAKQQLEQQRETNKTLKEIARNSEGANVARWA